MLEGDLAGRFIDFSHLAIDHRRLGPYQQRLPQRDDESPGPQMAWALFELARDHFYLMRVTSRKLARIAEGIAWAATTENVTVHLSLVRSLLEHAASLAFQVRELGRVEDNLSRQGDLATCIMIWPPTKRGRYTRRFLVIAWGCL
jgi:hypothetical protein